MSYAHIRRTRYGLRVAQQCDALGRRQWPTLALRGVGYDSTSTTGNGYLNDMWRYLPYKNDLRNEGVIALCMTGDSSNSLTLTGRRQLIRSSFGVISDPITPLRISAAGDLLFECPQKSLTPPPLPFNPQFLLFTAIHLTT